LAGAISSKNLWPESNRMQGRQWYLRYLEPILACR
jgi:hypothetical protein